ncbi:hypothetical protein [Streptomyces sp. NPDC094468]|uniref:hypothetical protein n=1 Tax=Streptomyces sp. NPDC094468 TaxID=3366066 RepID=UPI0037F780E9
MSPAHPRTTAAGFALALGVCATLFPSHDASAAPAEPSRFAVTMLTCRYYQKDHWSVQATGGAVPYVAWDGQYWWDRTGRRAGARLTHFSVDGRTAGIGDAVAALRASHFDNLADALSAYGEEAGETGLTVALPSDPGCAPIG